MKKKIKLAVVDDQKLFRKGLIALIEDTEQFDIVIEASNGVELMEKLKIKKPDVLLLDLQMPEMDGTKVAEILKKTHPDIRILILSMYNDDSTMLYLLEKGVRGFLLKDSGFQSVVDAISAVTENGYYFNTKVSKTLIMNLIANKEITPTFKKITLSQREIEIIRLVCQEFTNKEIASRLYLSSRTVEGHKVKILRKLQVKNVIGIVMYAVKNRLLE